MAFHMECEARPASAESESSASSPFIVQGEEHLYEFSLYDGRSAACDLVVNYCLAVGCRVTARYEIELNRAGAEVRLTPRRKECVIDPRVRPVESLIRVAAPQGGPVGTTRPAGGA